MSDDRTIARRVMREAADIAMSRMTHDQRVRWRRWMLKALAYRQQFPDATFDEVRTAMPRMRGLPAVVTGAPAHVTREIRRIGEAVRREEQSRT